MDDMLATLVFSVLIGAQFLAVVAARRVQQAPPPHAHHVDTPDTVRVRHIWLFG